MTTHRWREGSYDGVTWYLVPLFGGEYLGYPHVRFCLAMVPDGGPGPFVKCDPRWFEDGTLPVR